MTQHTFWLLVRIFLYSGLGATLAGIAGSLVRTLIAMFLNDRRWKQARRESPNDIRAGYVEATRIAPVRNVLMISGVKRFLLRLTRTHVARVRRRPRWVAAGVLSLALVGAAVTPFDHIHMQWFAPTLWYVDNSAAGANNGTSWTNAWPSMASIVWGVGGVVGGDTLYISGGAVSKTYAERIVVGASGSAGNVITISIGQDAGHTGTAILDGGGTLEEALKCNKSYVKVTGQVGTGADCKIRLTGGDYAGWISEGAYTNIEVAYLDIEYNGTAAGRYGIMFQLNHTDTPAVEIHHCEIHDNYDDAIHFVQNTAGEGTAYSGVKIYNNHIYNVRDDGIECAWAADIYDNEIGPRIDSGGLGHPDAIQFYRSYTRVWGNYIHGFVITTDPGNSNSSIFADPFGTNTDPTHIQIFNNLIVETEAPGVGEVHRGISMKFAEAGVVSANNILCANNTLYGVPYFGLSLTFNVGIGTADVSDIRVENNVFWDIGSMNPSVYAIGEGDGTITFGSDGDGADVTLDYNIAYASAAPYTTDVDWDSVTQSWALYKAASGCEDHGLNEDPDLSAVTYKPTGAGSAVVGVANVLPDFTTDKDGTVRGAAWDMGAYEYVAGGGGADAAADRVRRARQFIIIDEKTKERAQ